VSGAVLSGDESFMARALEEALRAETEGEVPVGAVVVCGGDLIARAHNRPVGLGDPTAHAEILAIREASRVLGNYRLTEATLYVTLEPCVMCVGAIVHARVGRLVFGAADPKAGAVVSRWRLFESGAFNHRPEVVRGVLEARCGELLSGFFRGKRVKNARNQEVPEGN
jgi:tRNA(adenine34) deaminase